MKLIECYIENFGKLSRFSYRFDGGMNSFCRENGWGKSTFAGFIKAMLYGLSASRSTDVQQNERLRYLPWQGGKCGGTLTFSVGDQTYRVERYFDTKESLDTFALYDCKTGLPSNAYTEKLGEELFDIDATGYERSTYISEHLTADERADYTGIQAKLVDMNDLSDFTIAKQKLEKRRKYYYVQGGRGVIAETSAKLSARRAELVEDEEALKKTNDLNRLARALDDKRDKLELQLRELGSQMDASLRIREDRALEAHKETLVTNLTRAHEKTASCSAYLSANPPSPAALEEQGRNWSMLSAGEPPVAPKAPLPAWLPVGVFALGVSAIVLGVILGIVVAPLYFLIVAAGLLAVIGGAALAFLRKRSGETMRIAHASRAEYDRTAASLRAFLAGYPIVMADPSLHNDGERLWAIRTKLGEMHSAMRAEEEAKEALDSFRRNHPALFSGEARNPDDERLRAQAEREHLTSEVEQVRRDRTMCEREIARYASAAARYSACAQEIASLEQLKKSQEKSLEIVQLTMQYLENARGALTTRYLTDIQYYFRHYMRILTEVDHDSAFSDEYATEAYTVTPDFTVNITKFGKTRSAVTLSRGGRDLVALCLRFAITDALFEGKKPPLILDDPFINLDDGKITAAMALLTRIAEDRQIFYVSCHSSRA